MFAPVSLLALLATPVIAFTLAGIVLSFVDVHSRRPRRYLLKAPNAIPSGQS